eukprot:3796890-Ditylum_brightwellii.AAC.2
MPQGCDGERGMMIRLDDLISLFKFRLEGYNVINVVLAGRGQFFFLPCVADEHGFGLVEHESCLFIVAACVLERLEHLDVIVTELVHTKLEVTMFGGQVV